MRPILASGAETSSDPRANDVYDRQVRAFGEHGQALIAGAKVAVVGAGGTGSPTAEQLLRLGVEDVVLIDPGHYEDSNVTRTYGTFHASAGRTSVAAEPATKVELVAEHLRRINPAAAVRPLPSSVLLAEAVAALLDRDLIFLCTDEHWGRSIVNQVAYQYLIPVINLGMKILDTASVLAQPAMRAWGALRGGQPADCGRRSPRQA